MKRYKLQYYHDRSKPDWISEISKIGRLIGARIGYSYNGVKILQCKCKNGTLNGLWLLFFENTENDVFLNWKKNKQHGIKIAFK